jgi:GNAT superfamily N-acetyltransferase
MSVTEVRPYRPADRAAIEDTAYRTGFMGESAEAFWRHRESFTSIWIAPYLNREPDSTFVATVEGKVMGYLTGCVDTAQFEGPDAVMMKEISRHGLLFRAGVAKFLWRAIADRTLDKWRGHPPVSGELHDSRWPSHLHVNLLPEARKAGLGRALMETWLARLRDVGSPGCHLGVIAENQRAVVFFSALGFVPHGDPAPIPGLRGRRGERLHQQIMVRRTNVL